MNNFRSNTTVQTYLLPSPNGGNKKCFAWLRSIMKKFADSMKRIAGFLPSPITRKFRCLGKIFGFLWRYSGARFLWRYSGLEHIRERLIFTEPSSPNYKKPPTFFPWVVAIYFSLYSIASTDYEATFDRANAQMIALTGQLSTDNPRLFGNLIAQIPRIQELVTRPKPNLLDPASVLCFIAPTMCSFVSEEEPGKTKGILKWTWEAIEDWKGHLAGVDFGGIYLPKANLREANLSKANLSRADLSMANLWGANLSETILWETNLHGAALGEANLSGADLQGADLSEADLQRVDLSGAFLFDANLAGADLSGIQNWRDIGSMRKANILGVRNAPEGFRAWAREQGAVEMAPEKWKAFVEPPAAMP